MKRSGLDYGSATPTTPILNYVIYEHCELLAAYEKLNQSIHDSQHDNSTLKDNFRQVAEPWANI